MRLTGYATNVARFELAAGKSVAIYARDVDLPFAWVVHPLPRGTFLYTVAEAIKPVATDWHSPALDFRLIGSKEPNTNVEAHPVVWLRWKATVVAGFMDVMYRGGIEVYDAEIKAKAASTDLTIMQSGVASLLDLRDYVFFNAAGEADDLKRVPTDFQFDHVTFTSALKSGSVDISFSISPDGDELEINYSGDGVFASAALPDGVVTVTGVSPLGDIITFDLSIETRGEDLSVSDDAPFALNLIKDTAIAAPGIDVRAGAGGTGTLVYTIDAVPAGVVFTNGVITGTPTAEAVSEHTVTVTDALAETVTYGVAIKVEA